MHNMSDVDSQEMMTKRERSRSPVGGGDDDRDRGRRSDRKPQRKIGGGGGGGGGRRAPPNHRVYVSNIPYEYKWQDLKDLFRNEVGEVNYVEMFKDDTGRPRGCGIIEFESAELAQKAIDQMHRYELAGRKLVVKEDFDLDRDNQGRIRKEIARLGSSGGSGSGGSNFSSGGRLSGGGGGGGGNMGGGGGSGSGPVNYGNTYGLSVVFLESLGITGPLVNKVFVANLDYGVDENQLREVFKVAGKVMNIEITKDQETSKSRGFGVVEYEHPVEAVQAISMLNGQLYYDRKMSVRMDRVQENKKGEGAGGSKLPQGLKGLGMGLGMNGAALTDVSVLSSNVNPTNSMACNAMQNMNTMQGVNNISAIAPQPAMGVMNHMAGNMTSPNMGTGLGMGALGNNMGNMASGIIGMNNNPAIDSSMGTSLMNTSPMMGNVMGGNNLGQGSVMSRMGASNSGGGYGSNFGGNSGNDRSYGGSNFGGSNNSGGVSGNIVQISNLPMDTTWQNLRDLCRDYGEIRFAEIRTKGTGTVKFMTETDARRAAELLDRQRFSGRIVEARII